MLSAFIHGATLYGSIDFLTTGDSIAFGTRKRVFPERSMLVYEPVFIGQSPGNEATIIKMPDGKIKIFFINRPGPADKMMSVTSDDNGVRWSKPETEFPLPGEAYYANNLVVSNNGDLHCIFHIWGKGDNGYNGRHLDLYHCKSAGETWTSPKKIYDGYVGSIRGFIQTGSGRLLLSFARAVPARNEKPAPGVQDYGWNEIISLYSDNLGETWQESDNGVNIPVDPDQVTRYGGVEPEILEMKDKRILMLVRTNKGRLYQSFSNDSGKRWSDPVPTNFITSDSPADLLRLNDGRIVLLWSGNQRWDDDRSYANGGREVLHAAISGDDGMTWKGYREVLISPAGHFIVKRDIGTAYPSAVETNEGKVLFVSGQAEERAIVMFDPQWLGSAEAQENFREDLAQWTLFGSSASTGMKMLPGKNKALHITKTGENMYHDTEAVWNFPMTETGKIMISLHVPEGSKGINLALTDHFSVSYDTLASANGVINISLLRHETGRKDNITITITWNSTTEKASVYTGKKLLKEVKYLRKPVTGINYLRVGIVGIEPDETGFYIKSVESSSGK
jgi:hypothetical protein